MERLNSRSAWKTMIPSVTSVSQARHGGEKSKMRGFVIMIKRYNGMSWIPIGADDQLSGSSALDNLDTIFTCWQCTSVCGKLKRIPRISMTGPLKRVLDPDCSWALCNICRGEMGLCTWHPTPGNTMCLLVWTESKKYDYQNWWMQKE